jgi:putative ABC transport system permease protein
VAAIPGVRRVQMVRDARVMFRKTPVMVVSVEVNSMAETAQLPPVAGNADEMYRRASAGEGLIVADNLARLQNLKLGDILEVPAPKGLIRLPIVGVIVDFSDQMGTIFMDRTLFIRYWNDDTVNVLRVYLNTGRKAACSRKVCRTAPGVRADESGAQELHPESYRSVVRADVGSNRCRCARGHPRNREHADRVDHRSSS